MLACCDGSAAADTRIAVGTSAVAARPGVVPIDIQRTGSLIVAAQGRLQWRAPELATHARQHGIAAAIAEAYRRHGASLLEYIGGSFAIAVLETRNGSGLLAVDRMGIRPLCYANPAGGLVFGSSAESVAAHPRVGRELSDQALFNYLYFHAVPSPGTIYRTVRKLQPGECVTFRNGAVEARFYWELRYAERAAQSQRKLEVRFRRLLREAAGRALEGDSEVGAFLSGGTDSSTVAGLLTELSGKPADTYSIGFAAEGFDEMDYARITARHFGVRPHEYYVTPQDVVETIPLVARAYDEPFGNASAVPTYLCARLARGDGVRTMLAGDGGDEIFGGNARYAWQKLFEVYGAIPAWLRSSVIEPAVFGLPGGARIPPWRKLQSYIGQSRIPLPDRLESYNFLQRSPLAEIFEPDFLARVDVNEPFALHREAYQRTASASAVDRMMHLDLKFTLADNDLRKVVRMGEVAGVEVRFPLIDDVLVEFSGEIPATLKVRGLKLRYFFKQALKDFLPPETLAKKKHGFGMPFGLWLRDHKPLADMAHESLAGLQRRGIVRPQYVAGLLRHHESSHATYYGVMIWVLMMLEQWLAARETAPAAPRPRGS
jgi:asparagine synthase (glutamine-hydrolysing)